MWYRPYNLDEKQHGNEVVTGEHKSTELIKRAEIRKPLVYVFTQPS